MLVLPGVVVLLELLAAACKPAVCKVKTRLSQHSWRAAPMPPHETIGGTAGNHNKSFTMKQRVVITVLSSLLFFYPTILQTTMSLFVCKTLDPAGGSDSVYQVSTM
jgi:hypothetical protein